MTTQTSTPTRQVRSFVTPPKPLDQARQRLVLVAALVTVLVDIASLRYSLVFDIGRIVVSISVIPAAVVLWIIGRRAYGHSRGMERAAPFWVAAILGAGVATVMLAHAHHLVDVPGVFVASLDEEVVYRFAVPAVVAAILMALKVRVAPARMIGFAVAAIWFVLLPGHRAQMHDPAEVLPFLAFAALAAIVVYRSGSFAATAAAHTVMNLLTILAMGGYLGRVSRSLGIAVVLVLLVAAYGERSRRVAGASTEPVAENIDLTTPVADEVIDLRDGQVPTHIAADGQSTSLGVPAEAERR